MDMRKLVGRNVRAARIKLGVTQERLAEVQGSRSSISLILSEAGVTLRSCPSMSWHKRWR